MHITNAPVANHFGAQLYQIHIHNMLEIYILAVQIYFLHIFAFMTWVIPQDKLAKTDRKCKKCVSNLHYNRTCPIMILKCLLKTNTLFCGTVL